MEIRLFGPVEADDEAGRPLDLGTRKQRACLAMLALEPGRIVPLDRLIEELWAGEAPAKATATLQAYISHLRRVLEPDRRPRTPPRLLLTREPGYLLDVTPAQTDVGRFTAWAEDGRRLARGRRFAAARDVLDRALELWRGEPLAEFPGLAPARLGELRLQAEEDRLEARLALGEASVTDLEALADANPYRERAWSLLVLGLYRAGRQADALGALRRVRSLLAEELGIEPGPELKRLERAVFDQSPTLDAPGTPDAPLPLGPDYGASLWGQEARRLAVLYTCRRGQGRVAEVLDELVATARRRDLTLVRPLAVLAALDVGKEDLAADLVARWGADLRDDWAGDFLFPAWGLVAARLGTPDPGSLYDRLLPVAGQLIVMGMGSVAWGSVHDVLSRLAARLGRAEEAAAHAEAAADTHRRLGLPSPGGACDGTSTR